MDASTFRHYLADNLTMDKDHVILYNMIFEIDNYLNNKDISFLANLDHMSAIKGKMNSFVGLNRRHQLDQEKQMELDDYPFRADHIENHWVMDRKAQRLLVAIERDMDEKITISHLGEFYTAWMYHTVLYDIPYANWIRTKE